ncbi:class I SAM-dependent methyltransferase [Persicobacter diffluens]|uniref:Methyltransferase domain-containing protein n=1 Tax=Persicobacter diffluens TaxID=981 RepID=A0AAN4VWG1_9BACT|nr:hypothetical protein PEDI_12490 [Persicobacter diffluens]
MSEFYKNEKTAQQYIQMTEGYDPSLMQALFSKWIKTTDTILELGSGPGRDLEWITTNYEVEGSDYSPFFVNLLKEKFPAMPVHQMDATALETDKSYDAIFSNKVLHHLEHDQLAESLQQQWKALKPGGKLLHTFWWGAHEEEIMELKFKYYEIEDLKILFEEQFEILEIYRYDEIEEKDSIIVVAKKK